LERLKQGAYGDLYEDIVNVNQKAFDRAMEAVDAQSDVEEFEEEVEGPVRRYQKHSGHHYLCKASKLCANYYLLIVNCK
jgi:hypothetical protein